jgi:hypothetical protein
LAQSDLALLILDGTSSHLSAVRQVETFGARIQHVFPPNVLVGYVPSDLSWEMLRSAGVSAVYRRPVNRDELAAYGESAQKAALVWNALLADPGSSADQEVVAQAEDSLADDALTVPDLPHRAQTMTSAGSGYSPDFYQTSEFMAGSVAVGIILPESDGSREPSTEDWTTEERYHVYSEIVAATDWWAEREPAANLTFVYDDHASQPIPTGYEPIAHLAGEAYLWIGEVMTELGYDSTAPHYAQVYEYVNELRATYQTDWAFAIFVVDSSNDPDNAFLDGRYAYAYGGGPMVVMTSGNNGWGPEHLDMVAAHEIGHIFRALDQYSHAGVPCTQRAGYLDVENQNSIYGDGCLSNEPSIMRGGVGAYASGAVDRYARGQVGWLDSDGDGILDPVDTTTEIALSREGTAAVGSMLRYGGTAWDIPFSSPRYRSVTINRIVSMAYRLDGGDWESIQATDGGFDSIEESFLFDVSSLSEGIWQLDLLVRTSLGGDRIIVRADVIVVPVPGSTAPMQELGDLPCSTIDNKLTCAGMAAALQGTVAATEFRVDEGEWQSAEAVDGSFDQGVEAFSFATAELSSGLHTIEVRSIDSRGQISLRYSAHTLEIQESHKIYLPLVMGSA